MRSILTIGSMILFSISISAVASEETLDFGSTVTVTEREFYSQADAEFRCMEDVRAIEDRIRELSADFALSSRIDRRILRRGGRGPRDVRYTCVVTLTSRTQNVVLRSALFKQKQDSPCQATFEQLISSRKMVFNKFSERRTLFRRKYVCSSQYVELLQR